MSRVKWTSCKFILEIQRIKLPNSSKSSNSWSTSWLQRIPINKKSKTLYTLLNTNSLNSVWILIRMDTVMPMVAMILQPSMVTTNLIRLRNPRKVMIMEIKVIVLVTEKNPTSLTLQIKTVTYLLLTKNPPSILPIIVRFKNTIILWTSRNRERVRIHLLRSQKVMIPNALTQRSQNRSSKDPWASLLLDLIFRERLSQIWLMKKLSNLRTSWTNLKKNLGIFISGWSKNATKTSPTLSETTKCQKVRFSFTCRIICSMIYSSKGSRW